MDELLQAFPDYHVVIEGLIAEEDKVVGLYTESGTLQRFGWPETRCPSFNNLALQLRWK